MNARFKNYVDNLTPAKQLLAREVIQEYLAGETEGIERLLTTKDVWQKSRWLADKETEHFVVYYMKNNYRIIKSETVAHGGLDSTIVDVRVVLKHALLCDATCITCVHNHPSGSRTPSRCDDKLTEKINRACDAIGIKLIDHVIVTDKDYYSYREYGKL